MKAFLKKIQGSFRGSIEFIRETRKELRNVTWPSRREVTGTTLVVLAAVFFFGFFLFIVDMIVNFGMDMIFRRVSP